MTENNIIDEGRKKSTYKGKITTVMVDSEVINLLYKVRQPEHRTNNQIIKSALKSYAKFLSEK